jgi:hypothetical protein
MCLLVHTQDRMLLLCVRQLALTAQLLKVRPQLGFPAAAAPAQPKHLALR